MYQVCSEVFVKAACFWTLISFPYKKIKYINVPSAVKYLKRQPDCNNHTYLMNHDDLYEITFKYKDECRDCSLKPSLQN